MLNEMKTSTTAVFYDPTKPFELKDLPIPNLQTGELLVRVEYTTLCRSDLYTYSGQRKEKSPTILGHEIVGRIAAFGPETIEKDLNGAAIAVGDRISWAIYASNPHAELSKRGIPQKADGLYKYGHEQLNEHNTLHGGLSEYIILKPHTPLLKISENIPLKIAAIINCAVATVAGGIRVAGPLQGKNVLVTGAGMLGMIACAMSRSQGAAAVVALDSNPERLAVAPSFGATHTIPADSDLNAALYSLLGNAKPIDVILELSGAASAMENTLEHMAIGGTAVWLGATFPQRKMEIDAEKMVRNLYSIKGLHNYNELDFIAAVQFIEQHHSDFPFETMIHDQFNLHQVNEAFAYAMEANPFRVGVRVNA